MTSARNVVESFYAKFGQGDLEGVIALFDDGVEWSIPGPPSVPYFGSYRGRSGVRQFFDRLFEAEDVLEFQVKELVGDGPSVAAIGREKARGKASGKTFETEWVQLFTVGASGLIVGWKEYIDTHAVAAAY